MRFKETSAANYRKYAPLQHSWMQRGYIFVYTALAENGASIDWVEYGEVEDQVRDWAQSKPVEIQRAGALIWLATEDKTAAFEFKLTFC